MRSLLIVAAIFGLSFAAKAEEPRQFDERALPHTEAALKALDDRQLRIVRRATSLCDATDPPLLRVRTITRRPCVISGADHAVETSDDPALQAYHAALPFNVRYDRFRPAYYYQQILVRYGH